jgi:prevent-host-death family protein
MAEINIHQAKTHFSRLIRRVVAGEEIVIARAGVPVVRLVPIEPPVRRTLGVDRGRFEVPEDFDAPLPEDVLREFEGS